MLSLRTNSLKMGLSRTNRAISACSLGDLLIIGKHTVSWLNSSVTLLVSKAPLIFLCVFEWIGHSVLERKCFFVFRGA